MTASSERTHEISPAEGKESRLLALLADCAARLLAASDSAAMIDYLFETVRQELKLDVYFHYAAQGDGYLFLEAHSGLTEEQARLGRQLRFGEAVCGTVACDRKPRLVSGIQAGDDPMTSFIRDVGLDSYACTPLVHGDVLLGTLGFGRRCPEPFTESELRFLRTICSYVAVAKNRLLVEAEMLATLRARDAVARAQSSLMQSVAQSPADAEEVALAAMLAHEMAQPLSAASNYIATVEMALSGTGGPDVLERLAQARAQITRSSQIVSRTRALVATGEVELEAVAVAALFAEAIEVVGAACPQLVPMIEIETEGVDRDVLADRVQIVQVLANLIRNAAQATEDCPQPRIELTARAMGEMVELCVSDNGPGFSEAPSRPRSSTTGGFGIGLLVSRKILAAHGSELEIGRAEPRGARLSFHLPTMPDHP